MRHARVFFIYYICFLWFLHLLKYLQLFLLLFYRLFSSAAAVHSHLRCRCFNDFSQTFLLVDYFRFNLFVILLDIEYELTFGAVFQHKCTSFFFINDTCFLTHNLTYSIEIDRFVCLVCHLMLSSMLLASSYVTCV